MKLWKKILCWSLLGVLCIPLWGCTAAEGKTIDYMEHMVSEEPSRQIHAEPLLPAEFAVRLLQSSYEGETCVLAPYSVCTVLAMMANGAEGETRTQMERVLGASTEQVNDTFCGMRPGEEVTWANALWIRNQKGFSVREDFLRTNGNVYGAEIYGAPFQEETRQEINRWVSLHTKNRITEALDSMDPAAALYLINAMTFDGRWEVPFVKDQVREDIFYGKNGEESAIMMESRENQYLETENAAGFLKDYKGGRYCLMALLPREGTAMEDFLGELSGDSLLTLVKNPQSIPVKIGLPKFETKTDRELSGPLSAMGMPLAFSQEADFSGIGDAPLKIGRLLHQTALKTDELGTEAGAAATAEVVFKGVLRQEKTVFLDRPFVMGVFDREQEVFLFLGVIDSVH